MGWSLGLTNVDGNGIKRVQEFDESHPSEVLGPRPSTSGDEGSRTEATTLVRAFLPRASEAWVSFEGGARRERLRLVSDGFFVAAVPSKLGLGDYTINFIDDTGYMEEREDPYSFGPFLTDYDLYLIGEGTHRRSYEKLGAHVVTRSGIQGVQFAVWAPNAKSVSVVGDFNHWMVGAHPMDSRGTSGVWELFVPRLRPMEPYKFAIKSSIDGRVVQKTDPYAFATELRPKTAARVFEVGRYSWNDQSWMERRRTGNCSDKPVAIYEVHLGSWRRKKKGDEDRPEFLSYQELAEQLIPYVKECGFTHLELMPVMEHPLDDSWGYQVVNYYAPTSRFGDPSGLMYFIDVCHQNGIGVILDWVPGHFPKDEYGLGLFDGSHLYEHSDPRKGVHPEWGTYLFNFARKEVRAFLISNAIFWLSEYHADGLRIDAVASMLYLDYARKPGEWIPNEFGGRENLDSVSFLQELDRTVHEECPGSLMIAEESTEWPGVTRAVGEGGLGFDMKWNMGWMHDTLDYFSTDPLFRKYHQKKLTFSIWYAFSEKFVLVLSHDEVVYGKRSLLNKMPGDDWRRFANLRLCLGYMYTHPGKKLLFMGGEFGQWNEWDFRGSLDWDLLGRPLNAAMRRWVQDLNRLYQERGELHDLDFSPEGFEWVDFADENQSVISFLRRSRDGHPLLVVFNMTPVPRYNYVVGVPGGGFYREVANSDAVEYGGSGIGNLGGVNSRGIPSHGKPDSVSLTLPPLAVVVLSPDDQRML